MDNLKLEDRKVLSEVSYIISRFDKKLYNKISKNVIEYIENNKDKNYTPSIDESIPFEKNKFMNGTYAFLATIYLNDLSDSKVKEKEIIDKIISNDKKNM